METDKLLNKIKKYYKKEEMFAELYLENYEEYNIYFRIDYFKKEKCYRLSWFDLNLMESYDIKKYISVEYIPDKIIEHVVNEFEKYDFLSKNYYQKINKSSVSDKAYLRVNTKTKKEKFFETTFYKYIPFEIKEISDIISIILNTAPRKLQTFLYELNAKLNGEDSKYNYKTKIKINIYKDEIKELFNPLIYEKGIKYYKENRVIFLEKVDTRYFAAIAGNQNVYLTIIDYHEDVEELYVHCSCPCDFYCKHLAAALESIQKNKIKRFFKIRYNKEKENLLIKYMNFEFLLCIGIVDNKFIVVNGNGNLETINILDDNNEYHWQILEDSKNNDLENQIKEILNRTDE